MNVAPDGKWAHRSMHLRHRDEECTCHKRVQSRSDKLVLQDGRIRLTWARNCTTGIRWRCDEDRDAECYDEDRDPECCDAATNGALDSRIRTSWHVTSWNRIFSSGNFTSRSSRQWWDEVLKRRCCRVRSKGDTDEVGPQQPGYIPNWVGKATVPPPAGAVSGWVMTP